MIRILKLINQLVNTYFKIFIHLILISVSAVMTDTTPRNSNHTLVRP